MKFKFIDQTEKYDGAQLVSLRSYLQHKILGDSIVAWIGACDIPFEHMVDGEDLNAGAAIRGDRMVHFIVEKFDSTLLAAVALQRLLASIVRDYLMEKAGNREMAATLFREGDDIYAREPRGGFRKKGLQRRQKQARRYFQNSASPSPRKAR